MDSNGLGGAVVGHWYHIFWPRLPSQNITPTRALLAPINIISPRRAGQPAARFCLQRGVLTLATLARLTTSRSTYGRTVAEPPYSKASPDIHVRHLGTPSATLLTATKQLRGSGSKRTCVVVLSAKAHRPESRAAAASVWPARRDRWRSRDDARSCVSVGPAPRAAVPSKGDSIGRVSGNSKATGLAESYDRGRSRDAGWVCPLCYPHTEPEIRGRLYH